MDWLNNIVAPLVVAVATGGFGYIFAKLQMVREQQKKLNDAPRKYVEHLDRLIRQAIDAGGEDAIVRARAIVAARDSMRRSLISISEYLNSEIDSLSRLLEVANEQRGQGKRRPPGTFSEVEQRLFETMRVLQSVWPSRRAQVEIEVRKLLAELGIEITILDQRE